MKLPRLYPIIDVGVNTSVEQVCAFAHELALGGARLLQYRNKSANSRLILEQAKELKRVSDNSVQLIMNDRADLCLAAGFDGVHVGQDDLSPEAVRKIIGDRLWLGVSTHNPEQVQAAEANPVDYVAVGPVFATTTKANPDPVIGLEGVRRARKLTNRPLVAIGGITRANCRSVLDAGADSVAVISDLVRDPRKSAEEFLRVLR